MQRVTLAAVRPPQPQEAPSRSHLPGEERRPTVLVGEHDAIARWDLVEELTDIGFRVVKDVRTGADAVKYVRELEPDVALLDASLLGMDGVSAAELIVEEGASVVLLLNGTTDVQARRRAEAMGVPVLHRPLGGRSLAQAVRSSADERLPEPACATA